MPFFSGIRIGSSPHYFIMTTDKDSNKINQLHDELIADKQWWKEAIVYQIYPRSFYDSNGDGIGDLKGIIAKLGYIESLGVDAVWINPIYPSPNLDNGYDISDYQNIAEEYGTMEDFDQLLQGLHKRNIRLIMDLVVNHTSHEHPWFQQSRKSRNNPYRNYYHWWNKERGTPPPRFSFFDESSNAWTYDEATDAYYLHYFSRYQPDLNWSNPKVREEVYNIMRFWLNKGVDGFRLDAFQFIAKDTTFPLLPEGYEKQIIKYYGNGPHLHDYLQEMNREVLRNYNVVTVAEGAGTSPQEALQFVDADRKELNMAYHFEGMDVGFIYDENKHRILDPNGYDLRLFKTVYSRWDEGFKEKGWGTIYLGNHDQPRMVSRWGNDSDEWRESSSKMLTTFILTMRATPYCYYGDEIGMTNIYFDSIDDYHDLDTINKYNYLQKKGGDLHQFINLQKKIARDNSRTPMQWNASPNGGFTKGKPWLKMNANYKEVNVEKEEQNENSCLHYFRRMIMVRKQNPALIYGTYTLLDENNPNVYAYTRELGNNRFLVLLNFSGNAVKANTHVDLNTASPIICNYETALVNTELRPYEAVVYKL